MQISFYSASEASDFIEIIRPICPCRLNPSTAAVPTQARTQAQTTERPMLRTQMTDFPSRTSSILTSGPLPPIPNPRPDAQMPNSYGQQISSPSILGPLRSSSPVIPHLNPPDILLRLSSDDSNVIRQTNVCSNSVPSITQLQPTPYPTQLPSSSLPSSSSANLDQPSSHSVPAPLASSRSVYDMSNAALEQLIGEIIHEDGFVQLVGAIYRPCVVCFKLPKLADSSKECLKCLRSEIWSMGNDNGKNCIQYIRIMRYTEKGDCNYRT